MKSTNASRSGIRTVLVDDSASFRRIMRYGLRSTPGIRLIGLAADGEQALKLVRRLQPQLVLIDISMPRMDGLTATRIIRKRHPSVRVAAISVAELSACRAKVFDSGAEWAIYKPNLHQDLKTLVEQWNERSECDENASLKQCLPQPGVRAHRREPKRVKRSVRTHPATVTA